MFHSNKSNLITMFGSLGMIINRVIGSDVFLGNIPVVSFIFGH